MIYAAYAAIVSLNSKDYLCISYLNSYGFKHLVGFDGGLFL
jgi:hypothetical protein